MTDLTKTHALCIGHRHSVVSSPPCGVARVLCVDVVVRHRLRAEMSRRRRLTRDRVKAEHESNEELVNNPNTRTDFSAFVATPAPRTRAHKCAPQALVVVTLRMTSAVTPLNDSSCEL